MAFAVRGAGPVKAWIEPDRLVFARAFPWRMAAFVLAVVVCVGLATRLHPAFWGLLGFVLLRQASREASLRELFREGMLHPAQLVGSNESGQRLVATLVRLDSAQDGVRDAVVVSRAPWRWQQAVPPWGGERAAMVIAGEPPLLLPLSPDVAGVDAERARAIVARIPEAQWNALARALSQVEAPVPGVHWVELGREPWYGSAVAQDPTPGMPPHLSENDTSLWCASMPCIEEPAMDARERARVVKLRRGAALWLLLRLLFSVLSVTGFVGLVLWVGARETPPPAWSSLFGLVFLFSMPVFLIASARGLHEVRVLSRDLAQGRVRRFAGPLSNYDSLTLDADLALLFRRGLLRAAPSMEGELVVLPHSGQLLYAGTRWAPRGTVLAMRRVADPPVAPSKLALPREYTSEPSDRNVELARRRMTGSETKELSEHARALRQPGSSFWWVFAFVAVALGAWHSEGFRIPPSSAGVPIALIAAAVAVWSTIRRVRLSLRIDRDVALGWVLTVDRSRPEEDSELPALGVETLLHAQLDWTVNQRPAAWRRFGRR
jgi:hypothetical protein